jgi:hypothetical protein
MGVHNKITPKDEELEEKMKEIQAISMGMYITAM